MKNKTTEWFPANCLTRSVEELQERFLFRVISRLSRRSVGAKGDISRAMILCLFAWIFVVVSVFAESYPNRPTASELEGIVISGTQCARGVNERCWATQYQTNPVDYWVDAPFVKTNNAGWYLGQSTMGTMASKIRSLVPYYADTNTVYDGTTNITMLTTNSVWAELKIGDRTNKFTGTPAIGTNPPTYGDYPWRIYVTNLQERYKVLNALKMVHYTTNVVTNAPVPPGISAGWHDTAWNYGAYGTYWDGDTNTWDSIKIHVDSDWGPGSTNYGFPPQSYSAGVYYNPPVEDIPDLPTKRWDVSKVAVLAYCRVGPFPTNGQEYSLVVRARSIKAAQTYWSSYPGMYTQEFTSVGAFGAEGEWVDILNVTNSTVEWQDSGVYGSSENPEWCLDPTLHENAVTVKGNVAELGYEAWYGPQPAYTNIITNYIPVGTSINYFTNYPNFQYCTDE